MASLISYPDAVESVIKLRVDAEDAEETRENFRLERIEEKLRESDIYTFFYREKRSGDSAAVQKRMKEDIYYLDEYKDVLVFLLTDVTEIFEQESETRERMASALAAANQASAAKSSFLSRVSHGRNDRCCERAGKRNDIHGQAAASGDSEGGWRVADRTVFPRGFSERQARARM